MASLSISFPEGVCDKYGMSLMVQTMEGEWLRLHFALCIVDTSSSRTS